MGALLGYRMLKFYGKTSFPNADKIGINKNLLIKVWIN
jgi:hypothetical protein